MNQKLIDDLSQLEEVYPYFDAVVGGGIYLIYSDNPILEVSIGQAHNFAKRLRTHLQNLKKYVKNPLKYVKFYILEYTPDYPKLNGDDKIYREKRESFWQKYYQVGWDKFNDPKEYDFVYIYIIVKIIIQNK
jgi:hypothetical protein